MSAPDDRRLHRATVVKMDDGLITLRGASGVELDFIPTAITHKCDPPAVVPRVGRRRTSPKKATRSNGAAGTDIDEIDDRQPHPHDRDRVRFAGGDVVTGVGPETGPGPGRRAVRRLQTGDTASNADMQEVITILGNRVNGLGVSAQR